MKRFSNVGLSLTVVVLFGLLLFGSALVHQAVAAGPVVLKVPTDQPPGSPLHRGWLAFEQFVESNTGGKYDVQVYHSAQLGDSIKVMEAIKMGIYKIVQSDEGICGAYDPMLPWQIPYLYPDEEVLRRFFESGWFKKRNDMLARDLGVRIIGGAPYGFYCFINKKRPVRRLEDLKGLKFRTLPGSQLMIAAYKGLGISGTPVSWTEVYTAIKTGVVDGVSHTPYLHVQQKFMEVAKHLTLDFSFPGVNTYMVHEKWWQSLPKVDQGIIQQGARIGSGIEYSYSTYRNRVTAIGKLKENNVKIFTLKPEEKERIKKAAQKAALDFVIKKAGRESVEEIMKTVRELEEKLYYEDKLI